MIQLDILYITFVRKYNNSVADCTTLLPIARTYSRMQHLPRVNSRKFGTVRYGASLNEKIQYLVINCEERIS